MSRNMGTARSAKEERITRSFRDRHTRVPICVGSGKRPNFPFGNIGFCPSCGVRTFLTPEKRITLHGALPFEVREQQMKPRVPR